MLTGNLVILGDAAQELMQALGLAAAAGRAVPMFARRFLGIARFDRAGVLRRTGFRQDENDRRVGDVMATVQMRHSAGVCRAASSIALRAVGLAPCTFGAAGGGVGL